MQELIGHAVSASHRIQYNLRPPVLDAGWSPHSNGKSRIHRPYRRAGDVESNRDEIVLAPERAAAIYRVAQEALANVSKYAQATRVTVHLFVGADEITLEVADNASALICACWPPHRVSAYAACSSARGLVAGPK